MGSVAKPLTRHCARCKRALSRPRSNARKKYCARCEQGVKRERSEKAHRARVEATYGLKPGDYDRMYEAQGGCCYICWRAKGISTRLAVDHDHSCCRATPTCGRCNRGLLCKSCNKMLGHARDDPMMFHRAADYLMQPPAMQVLYAQTGNAPAPNSGRATPLRGRRNEAA